MGFSCRTISSENSIGKMKKSRGKHLIILLFTKLQFQKTLA